MYVAYMHVGSRVLNLYFRENVGMSKVNCFDNNV